VSTRRKAGKLVRVSAAQTVSEGRPSRAKAARPLEHRPIAGEEGALAGLVFSMSDPALFGPDGEDKRAAQKHVRYSRRKVRDAVGDELQAREVFALASVQASELATLRGSHEALRPYLIEQRVAAVKTMRELRIETHTARAGVAVAHRLTAIGLGLLDVGAKALDPTMLKLGRDFIEAAGRHVDRATDLDRRAKLNHPPATSFTPGINPTRLQAERERLEDERDNNSDAAADTVMTVAASGASSEEDESPQDQDLRGLAGAENNGQAAGPSPIEVERGPTDSDAASGVAPPGPSGADPRVEVLTHVRPSLPPHLAALMAPNPFYEAEQERQAAINASRARRR